MAKTRVNATEPAPGELPQFEQAFQRLPPLGSDAYLALSDQRSQIVPSAVRATTKKTLVHSVNCHWITRPVGPLLSVFFVVARTALGTIWDL